MENCIRGDWECCGGTEWERPWKIFGHSKHHACEQYINILKAFGINNFKKYSEFLIQPMGHPSKRESIQIKEYNMPGLKFPKALSRAIPYDGEKVWDGEWFAGIHRPGARCCAVLRKWKNGMSLPWLIGNKRETFPTTGGLGSALWQYHGPSIVLDGTLATEREDGLYYDKPKCGEHIPLATIFFVDDLYSFQEFKDGQGEDRFTRRRSRLKKFLKKKYVGGYDKKSRPELNRYRRIQSKSHLLEMAEHATMGGFDLILRRNVPYQSGKTGNILLYESVPF